MIKVKEIKRGDNFHSFDVSLYADTKEEVTPNATIDGLPDGATIEPGSTVYTAALEVGVYQSDGTVKWG